MTEYKKKLIEVALPLEAINEASRHEKNPFLKRHPRAMHVWWSRKPLSTCRAVLFASLVDDPSAHPEQFPTEDEQDAERQRLFRIIEELVRWENSCNESVLRSARNEILRSTDGNPPPILDPFCGGGSIPLEAQRLGLEAHASDLNPVAVLITKALIEIPPKFVGLPPVHPEGQARLDSAGWHGTEGLAADVRFYGRWMRDEAERRIGHLYPKVALPEEFGGGEATVLAWLWARTIKCPNPACGAEVPLTSKWSLSTKKGSEAWLEPIVDARTKTVRLRVRTGLGAPTEGTKVKGKGRGFRCLVCGTVADMECVHAEIDQGRAGTRLLAEVTKSGKKRVYVDACSEQEQALIEADRMADELADQGRLPTEPARGTFGGNAQGRRYGFETFSDYFSARQLVALVTLTDLVAEARELVRRDAEIMSACDSRITTAQSEEASHSAYADAIATYLGLATSRFADFSNFVCSWDAGNTNLRQLFARQAISIAWDIAETNPLCGVVGIEDAVGWSASALEGLVPSTTGQAVQLDATAAIDGVAGPMISTDPPYYDNIGYADLADFFYVWLRRSLRDVYPDLLSALLTPKSRELVASRYRFGGSKDDAHAFFETALGAAFASMAQSGNRDIPLTLYYAFKQSEQEDQRTESGTASTGWDAMLAGLLRAGFSVTGTWPMRTEQRQRSVASGTNALASSVILVCRPRSASARLATRKEFIGVLRADLPEALKRLQHGNIAPVDLAQASIGPGMAVFSGYSKVLEADGTQMSVRAALALINQILDEILAEQEGEFDADTRWSIAWFEQFGTRPGEFGVAETLSKAKGTSVAGMVQAGILEAKGGKVRLLGRDELGEDWDPATDMRLTVWEMTQHLLRRLDDGEVAAAALARRLGSFAEVARDLAYRLYVTCERKKWSQEGQAYNGLVVAWPQIQRLAAAEPASAGQSQTSFEV